MGMKQSETIYRQWLGEKELDPALRRELLALAGNEKEIEERFYTELRKALQNTSARLRMGLRAVSPSRTIPGG